MSTGNGNAAIDNLILIAAIVVVGAVFIVSVVVVVCVLRKSGIGVSAKNNGHSKMDSGSGVAGSGSSTSGEQQTIQ